MQRLALCFLAVGIAAMPQFPAECFDGRPRRAAGACETGGRPADELSELVDVRTIRTRNTLNSRGTSAPEICLVDQRLHS